MASLDLRDCLSVLEEVVNTNCIDGEPIHLNKLQCKFVAHTCILCLTQLGQNPLPARLSEEIRGTLQDLFAFFKCCTENVWLISLATCLDPQEAHILHLKNFMVCAVTSLALAQHLSNASPFLTCFLQSTSDLEKNVCYPELEAQSQTDRHDMHVLLSKQRKPEPMKQRCFPCFSKRGPPSQKCRLAAFVADKCDEVVRLSATPTDVPKGYHIASRDLDVSIRHLLGAEGASRVYEQNWLGQVVAVKEFDSSDGTFMKETSYLAGLSNPYIVKLIGWSKNEAKGTYSLVMERMQEGLHDFLSCNSPSLSVAVDIMLQISRGMQYLHFMKVIHRDLKPANVLVHPSRRKGGYLRVKLSDFGIAKFKPENMLFSTERQGTWYYRAPEVLQYADSANGEGCNIVFKKYTLKADVFSFAILCYEILAERAPDCYVNCHPREFYNRVTNNVRPQLPDSCPLLLADCIKRCWHSEPSKRPSFAELTKLLVYMRSALLAFESPTVAGLSASITNFLCEDWKE